MNVWDELTSALQLTPEARTASMTASTFLSLARWFALRVEESLQGTFL